MKNFNFFIIIFFSLLLSFFIYSFMELFLSFSTEYRNFFIILESVLYYVYNTFIFLKQFLVLVFLFLVFIAFSRIKIKSLYTKFIIASSAIFLIVIYTYNILIQYEKFLWYVPFVLFFLLIIVIASVQIYLFYKYEIKKKLLIFLNLLVVVGVFILYLLNNHYFFGYYPTLHYSVLLTGFFLLVIAVYIIISCFSSLRMLWIPALIIILTLGFSIYKSKEFTRKGFKDIKNNYYKYTILGSTAVFHQDFDSHENAFKCNESEIPKLTQLESIEIFNKYSNYPSLSDGFDLSNYNVVFLVIDSFNYLQTSLYSKSLKNMPFLGKLVNESLFFKNAFSPSTSTGTSMASYFSMTYPSFTSFKIRGNGGTGSINETAVSYIPRIFKANNYETVIAGHIKLKWNVTHIIDGFTNRLFFPKNGFEFKEFKNKHSKSYKFLLHYRSDLQTQKNFISFLDTNLNKKIFAYLHYYTLHQPYFFPGSFQKKIPRITRYRKALEVIDKRLEEIYKALKNKKLFKKTVFIITADHGENISGRNLKRRTRGVYNESVHVPLIIKIPGIKPKIISKPTSVSYLFPWLLNYGNKKMKIIARKKIQNDLAPVLKKIDGAVVIEILQKNFKKLSIVKDNYKYNLDLIHNGEELYNILEDPFELKNIIFENSERTRKYNEKAKDFLKIKSCKKKLTYADIAK